ncbi:polysaccharide biosynthesis/export family protein [Achromobacter xylosoxidans]|jgi:polysaccharide export outer membrane protein|uniref:Multidrug MFS transporter n=1 Tax=Alcaligenes xylosoxydans xylosoxydans TaxID=85698 RepID=A0A0D6I9M1_ALCXX|nr:MULTISPECIES: polysaccharide biosynthesis/export family protein [Achromobacter]EFV84040.1 polysaccharide export protein [Achromobacter xylosoxidans C54]AHC48794.1 Polysaccharide export lipoprotein Wza [Achromobacter xylosoxidans NBRC 15126 = ATCC 27061]AMH04562.1 multidrug MFS transporter [Achromobacter xylosoxidans]AXA78944.1 multidrug MFS transporter [Achromobacter xylosoxidans]KAA5926170.1 multidrug MFS transporter [Achromobacter xylosoxidans]
MTTFFGTLSRAIAAIALVSSLGACALSPGMTFNSKHLVDPLDPNSVAEIKEITPSLVLADHRARQALLDNDGVSRLVDKTEPYRIGPGDILSIVVWDHPELVLPTQTYAIGTGVTELAFGDTASGIPGYTVSSSGYIQFPYTGLLKVAGLTELQARNLIVNSSGKYIQDPQITVRVLGYRSKRVYVEGEVKTPGTVAINDIPMTLLEAINRAGGILPTGDRSSVYVIRDGRKTRVNLPALIERGQDLNQVMLKSGDIVRVTPRDESKIFVTGEVTTPAAITMRDGRLTLNEALGEAGGPNQLTADSSQVFVVRSTEQATPLVFHLNAASPQAYAVAEKFELQPKDVVFVDTAALVRWNRFISNLFPSAQTVQTVHSIK